MNNNRGGPRPCRYGSTCRNPTCSFDHTPSVPSSNMPVQTIMCRYGPSCWRQDCKYSHEYQNSSSSSPYNQHPYGISPYSAPTQQLCRFGAACFTSECRFAHPPPINNQPDVEFTSEEEEFMDEILDMIEQEQKQNNNKSNNSNGGNHLKESYNEEDDKNIDEILDFIDQQGHQTVFETEYISAEDAEKEYKDMLEFDAQRRAADTMVNGLVHMNIKGMSATAQPFVPRTSS